MTFAHRHSLAQSGFSLLEVLVSLIISATILVVLTRFTLSSVAATDDTTLRVQLTDDGQFALQRMRRGVSESRLLVLPSPDNPATVQHPMNSAVSFREDIREQTVPATVGQEFATAVLAVALGSSIDFDKDGFADSDNDRDGVSDEDANADYFEDGAPGIVGIDDDGDGQVDEGVAGDDDEDGLVSEDPLNGIDDDGDGRLDEDPSDDQDASGDANDDSDGSSNEDWPDVLVFFLSGSDLIERRPDRHASSGTNYTESVIAENVSRFRIERIEAGIGRYTRVRIVLELRVADTLVEFETEVRVSGSA